jgi:hypothetical protein
METGSHVLLFFTAFKLDFSLYIFVYFLIFINHFFKLKISIIPIVYFFLISQNIISKAQRGATLSTLGEYKRDTYCIFLYTSR